MSGDPGSVHNVAMGIGPSDRRPEMLRHVTDLFIVNADRLAESEIALFDDVLNRLIVDVEISYPCDLEAQMLEYSSIAHA